MVIILTKLEAARRQLNTAIELWFTGGDPVSIHVLAYGAHEIIHRVFRKRGLSDLMFDSAMIKEEHRGGFGKMLKEDANFFKHANREDEHEQRTFNPLANDLFLLMSVVGLERMKLAPSDKEAAFKFWHFLHKPSWFPEELVENNIPFDRLEQMRNLNRADLYKGFLEAMVEKRRRGVGLDGKPAK